MLMSRCAIYHIRCTDCPVDGVDLSCTFARTRRFTESPSSFAF
uniref:Uncharacterized protein n=1 Tax=Arundo donax TaxID=35708 RepID=A0A0A9GAW6_ARUDO